MGEKLTGSEKAIRKHMLECECGVMGTVFVANGSFFAGHFCKNSNCWTSRSLQQVGQRELMEFYFRLHHMGPV